MLLRLDCDEQVRRSEMTNAVVATEKQPCSAGTDGPAIAQDSARWHVLGATWLGELFDGMDASICVLTLVPALSELLGTQSHVEIAPVGAAIMATFIIGWTIGGMVFGALSDYIGRSRTLTITILLYAVCTGLCALSHNWMELAFYRFLVGCGIGGEIGIGAVMVAECWRGRSRVHAAGVLASSFAFGYLVAAVLNLCLGGFGWRWLFVAGIAPALVTLYIRSHVKEPEQFVLMNALKKSLRARRRSDLTGEEKDLIAFTFPKMFAGANLRNTLVVIGLATPAIVGYWAVLSWIPSWINQLVPGGAIAERSAAAVAMNLGAICSTLSAGMIVSKVGRQSAFKIASAGALLSCLLLFGTVSQFGAAFILLVFLLGAFACLPFALLFVYVPELFDASIRGTAFGFSVTVGRIVAAAATIAGGQLIAFFGGSYPAAGMTVGMIYILGLAVSFVMPMTSGKVEFTLNKTGSGVR
jgi:MFS family permease